MQENGTYDSLVALLANTIDYAGTFRPASLSLGEALGVAALFRRSSRHPWLLNKCAFTLNDLMSLDSDKLYRAGGHGSVWEFTALGTPEQNPANYFASLISDVKKIESFNVKGSQDTCRRIITSYETKLPVVPSSSEFASMLLGHFRTNLGGFRVHLYLEIPWGMEIEPVAEAFWKERGLKPGLKFRTGGAYIPKPAELAFAIDITNKRNLRFKATQGLHHPFTNSEGYGFVNLFGSLCFSRNETAGFGMQEMVDCLSDTHSDNFSFLPAGFRWKNYEIDLGQIARAKASHAGCFGSCSIQEPDEHLQTALGK